MKDISNHRRTTVIDITELEHSPCYLTIKLCGSRPSASGPRASIANSWHTSLICSWDTIWWALKKLSISTSWNTLSTSSGCSYIYHRKRTPSTSNYLLGTSNPFTKVFALLTVYDIEWRLVRGDVAHGYYRTDTCIWYCSVVEYACMHMYGMVRFS